MQLVLASRPSSRCQTVPQLFADGEFLGGCSDALVLHAKGELEPKLRYAAGKALVGGEAALPRREVDDGVVGRPGVLAKGLGRRPRELRPTLHRSLSA